MSLSHEVGGLPFWTFLSEELPEIVSRFLRVSSRPEDSFVAGLSMGGYGAVKWALREPGRFAAPAMRGLLGRFGDLRQLLDAPAEEFCAVHGLGEASYVQFQAALELARRYLLGRLSRGEVLASPAEVRQFLQLKMRGLPHEVFAVLFLDNQHAVISYEELFRGTIDGASVYPREVQLLNPHDSVLVVNRFVAVQVNCKARHPCPCRSAPSKPHPYRHRTNSTPPVHP